MAKIQDITIDQLRQSEKSEPMSSGNLERDKIIKLWLLMTSMYGHKWTSSYGTEVDIDKVWQASLKGISESKIKQGLSLISKNGAEWPPSAPEFRKICLDGDDTWEQQGPAYKRFDRSRALPVLPATKEFNKSKLDKIREDLNI